MVFVVAKIGKFILPEETGGDICPIFAARKREMTMWILLAALSAACLGFYDVFKKASLKGNAVIPVLLVNCALCALFFMPFIIGSAAGLISPDSQFYIPSGGWHEHKHVVLKAVIVLSSWVCGYYALKYLPLTIAGPINATRPVMVLVGALLFFGERLNLWQWAGVVLAIISFFLLSLSGKKEGIYFRSNKWIWLLVAAAVLGALSGLYDKYLMAGLCLDRLFVQGWYNLYQTLLMLIFLLVWLKQRDNAHKAGSEFTAFHWNWCIPLISIFLSAADLLYLYALTLPGALIAVVSMVRRCSVLVSFLFGALMFREKNVLGKVPDLLLVLLSLVCLLLGTL